jgi:hypothetical protein
MESLKSIDQSNNASSCIGNLVQMKKRNMHYFNTDSKHSAVVEPAEGEGPSVMQTARKNLVEL